VSGSGVLHIVWPTIVHDEAGDHLAICDAESSDAGEPFTLRSQVSASYPQS